VFAITGAPNVGKSSLMNALAERDVAIVSEIAGTTRDALETRVVLGGVPVTLVDTAGLRAARDPIEAEGVRRAQARAAGADLVLVVEEAAPLGAAHSACFPELREGAGEGCVRALRVINKIDLGGTVPPHAIGVSACTGAGLDTLRDLLAEEARALTEASGPPALTRARHRAALQEVAAHLARACDATLAELRAEDLRLAMRALGRITGQVGVEDLLDTIFARFCIGK
jgi:tRNA modification GTPase